MSSKNEVIQALATLFGAYIALVNELAELADIDLNRTLVGLGDGEAIPVRELIESTMELFDMGDIHVESTHEG